MDERREPWGNRGGVETERGRVIGERWNQDMKCRPTSTALFPWAGGAEWRSESDAVINSVDYLHAAHKKKSAARM